MIWFLGGFFFFKTFFFCDPIRDPVCDPIRDPVCDPIHDPVWSDPVQSGPVRSNPGFVDAG